jgi:hypothetical protein
MKKIGEIISCFFTSDSDLKKLLRKIDWKAKNYRNRLPQGLNQTKKSNSINI